MLKLTILLVISTTSTTTITTIFASPTSTPATATAEGIKTTNESTMNQGRQTVIN